jgi:hypothetical protein
MKVRRSNLRVQNLQLLVKTENLNNRFIFHKSSKTNQTTSPMMIKNNQRKINNKKFFGFSKPIIVFFNFYALATIQNSFIES